VPALPAAALPLAHPDAGPSHVEEWDEPQFRVEAQVGEEPARPGAAAAPPQAPPAADTPQAAAKATPALRRPRTGSDEHPDAGVAAKPATPDPLALPPPTVRRGAVQSPTQPLDMTELPAPAWAKPPSSKRPSR
jgi:hypothetical protein